MSYKLSQHTEISEREAEIRRFWEENKIFEKSIEQRDENDKYSFYDGPPFVTGIPHYGQFLGRIAKDVYPRFWTMKGKRVRRVWGWDCHGLPIEEKTEKKLGLKDRRAIEDYGIGKFIKGCRTYVEETSSQWDWYIERIAEWIDMKNAYRTMDTNFMESVIWAFKQLYDKGLVYQGRKTLLYCPRCGTPVSKFEIAMDNSYKDMQDPAVTAKFKLKYHKTGRGFGIVIRNEKDEILVARRNEKGREKSIGIVGGKLEDGETIEETINRECLEEIGVVPKNIEVVGSSIDIFEGRLFHTSHVKGTLKSNTKLEIDDALTNVEWISEDKINWDELHIPTRNCLLDVLGKKEFTEIEQTEKGVKPEKPPVYMLAWTTTPWTLPSNKALVVDPDETYVRFKSSEHDSQPASPKDGGEHNTTKQAGEINNKKTAKGCTYIMAKKRLKEFMLDEKYEVMDEFEGKEMVGLDYEPVFNYFEATTKEHKVYTYPEMVNMKEGTGIVHSAPGFGEIDSQMGQKYGLGFADSIDDSGRFIEKVEKWAGKYIKDADSEIIKDLDERGLLFRAETITHSYPFCYRCETPLYYRSVKAWFVNIQKIKKEMLKNNEDINWIPENIKDGRFKYTMETAPDWCISRTRYWATVMPVWKCKKCGKVKVVGSIKEIEKNAVGNVDIKGLHRNDVDKIKFKCEKCGGEMSRIPEVLDVWFESGAMSFAQFHYPFENKREFEGSFPADYIVEYVAQTRAWFYYLHVLSTILFGSKCFKNVIATGTMAGDDGRKMSKS